MPDFIGFFGRNRRSDTNVMNIEIGIFGLLRGEFALGTPAAG